VVERNRSEEERNRSTIESAEAVDVTGLTQDPKTLKKSSWPRSVRRAGPSHIGRMHCDHTRAPGCEHLDPVRAGRFDANGERRGKAESRKQASHFPIATTATTAPLNGNPGRSRRLTNQNRTDHVFKKSGHLDLLTTHRERRAGSVSFTVPADLWFHQRARRTTYSR